MLLIRDELVEPLEDDVFVQHNIIDKEPVGAGIDEVVVVTICFELRGHVVHVKGQAVFNQDGIIVKLENFGFFTNQLIIILSQEILLDVSNLIKSVSLHVFAVVIKNDT